MNTTVSIFNTYNINALPLNVIHGNKLGIINTLNAYSFVIAQKNIAFKWLYP